MFTRSGMFIDRKTAAFLHNTPNLCPVFTASRISLLLKKTKYEQ